MTDIERHTGSSLTLTADQDFWNDRQVAALQQLGVDRATKGDLAVFMHVAQRTGLDPFARQIYMIERQGKQTIQTGIDGFRLVARRAVDRAGESLAIGGGEWCGPDGNWRDVWLDEDPPAAARVVVRRGGDEFVGVALFREYKQTRRDGALMAQWATRPAGMLAKCAEALALRKAFPMDLAGVYTDDELGNAEPRRRREPSPLRAALDGDTPTQQPAGPGPDAEGVYDADVVEDPPAVTDAEAVWQQILTVAAAQGMNLGQVLDDFPATMGGLLSDTATAAELTTYLGHLTTRQTA